MKVFQKRISLFLAILLTLSTLMVVPFTASAEETATENWYDANATVLEVGSYADLLAFVEACNDGASDVTGSDGYDEAEKAIMNRFAGKTVKLTVDIDMADKTWNQIAFFAGTFDGQGHTIRNLTMTAPFFGATTGNAVIQNLVIVDGSLVKTTASNLAFFVFQPTAGSVTTFNNIYLDATISGAGNVGGFVSRLNLGATVKFNNCVSNAIICSTGNGAAGFVANAAKDNTVEMTDCVFTGDITSTSNVTAAMVGFTTGNVKLERCVVLGKTHESSHTYRGALLFLDHQNQLNVAPGTYSDIQMIDCYAASVLSKGLGISSGRGFYFNISMKYNGEEVFAHNDKDVEGTLSASNGAYSKVATADAAFRYLGTKDGTTLTVENFATTCPALKTAGWVLTGNTVTYATDKTVPEIMPETVADMITNPLTVSHWQVKEGASTNDFRFVAKLNFADLTVYDEVGYEVTVKVQGADADLITKKQVSTTTVYTSVTAGNDSITAESLGATYLVALSINGFKNADVTYEVTITPIVKVGSSVIHDYDNALTGTITGNTFTKA